MDNGLIGTGLYSLTQAARLVNADARAVRRWILGYNRTYNGKPSFIPPLWTRGYVNEGLVDPVVSFRDLLELRLVNAFAKHGVHLSVIRATAAGAREMFDSEFPLSMRRFRTDGRRIFAQAVEGAGEAKMIDPARKQYVFSEIVTPSLYDGIEYVGDEATRWFPARGKSVVLDPERQFGQPILSEAGIPTDTIFASYRAEGNDREIVARLYDIRPRDVDEAVRFEQALAA